MHEILLPPGDFASPFPSDGLERRHGDGVRGECAGIWRPPVAAPDQPACCAEHHAIGIHAVQSGVEIEGGAEGVIAESGSQPFRVGFPPRAPHPVAGHGSEGKPRFPDLQQRRFHLPREIFTHAKFGKPFQFDRDLIGLANRTPRSRIHFLPGHFPEWLFHPAVVHRCSGAGVPFPGEIAANFWRGFPRLDLRPARGPRSQEPQRKEERHRREKETGALCFPGPGMRGCAHRTAFMGSSERRFWP